MWFEVFFFDNLSEVFKKEKAVLRSLGGGGHKYSVDGMGGS